MSNQNKTETENKIQEPLSLYALYHDLSELLTRQSTKETDRIQKKILRDYRECNQLWDSVWDGTSSDAASVKSKYFKLLNYLVKKIKVYKNQPPANLKDVYSVGQHVFTYMNPLVAAPIQRVRLSRDKEYQNQYFIDGCYNWTNGSSIFFEPLEVTEITRADGSKYISPNQIQSKRRD